MMFLIINLLNLVEILKIPMISGYTSVSCERRSHRGLGSSKTIIKGYASEPAGAAISASKSYSSISYQRLYSRETPYATTVSISLWCQFYGRSASLSYSIHLPGSSLRLAFMYMHYLCIILEAWTLEYSLHLESIHSTT